MSEPIDIDKERQKRLMDLPEMGPEYEDAGPPAPIIEPATDDEVREIAECMAADPGWPAIHSHTVERLIARIRHEEAETELYAQRWRDERKVSNDLFEAMAELVDLKRIKDRSLGRRWPGLDADYQHRKAKAWAAAFAHCPE